MPTIWLIGMSCVGCPNNLFILFFLIGVVDYRQGGKKFQEGQILSGFKVHKLPEKSAGRYGCLGGLFWYVFIFS